MVKKNLLSLDPEEKEKQVRWLRRDNTLGKFRGGQKGKGICGT